ncbi:hypothetical protein P8452_64031 [Trifolium repens]|nr:hypothetical protein P8452_64031 [Trifolium repens]
MMQRAVAYGAAVQASLLIKGIKNVPNLVLQDVTPLSLVPGAPRGLRIKVYFAIDEDATAELLINHAR